MSLHPAALTWTALLGRWMDFARASVAIPDDADGPRWRDSVPAVINLQAVTFALAELDEIDPRDRAHARDKAELLIAGSAARLDEIWRGEPMAPALLEICADARSALEASAFAGAVELIWDGPGTMIMPEIQITDSRGTIAIMQPGTIVMPGEPVAWWVDRSGDEIVDRLPGCRPEAVRLPRQVYRQIDEAGRITGDLVAPIDADLPPGMPLLVPLLERGRPIGHFTMAAVAWLQRQRDAMTGELLAVQFADDRAKNTR